VEDLRAKVGHSLLVLPAVTGVVYDDNRRALMIRHTNDGKWCFPGGIVEPDEHPEQRVVKEMREETGLTVEPVRILGVCAGPDCRVEYANGDVVSYVSIAYECTVIGGTPTPDAEETLETRFVSRVELERLPLSAIGSAEARVAFRVNPALDHSG
jgi:ADP-ribose pyrophosphatase YjhB (NUDIX family)